MDVGSLVAELFDYDKSVLMTLIYVGVVGWLYGYFNEKKHFSEYLRALRWRIFVVGAAIGHLLLIWWKYLLFDDTRIFLILVVGNIIWDGLAFIILPYIPSSTQRKLNHIKEESWGDLLKTYADLREIDKKRLTPKEMLLWTRECYMNLYLIGSVNKAIDLMETVEEENSALRRMLYSLRAETLGNTDEALKKMLRAADSMDTDELGLKTQIYNNIGRCYRFCNNQEAALRYYEKAADLLNKKSDRAEIHTIYGNLIIQNCILNKDVEILQQLLQEYKNCIDENDLIDMVEYGNILLAIARESHQIWDVTSVCEESYDQVVRLLENHKEDNRRITYFVSALRVAHMSGMELHKYMKPVVKNLQKMKRLEMPDRYYMAKELFVLTIGPKCISGTFIEQYKEVFEYAADYIRNYAADDLEGYLSDIPQDAVYAYGNTQQEIIWLKKFGADYDIMDIYDRFSSVIELYRSQALRLEAIISEGCLIDELVALPNINPDFTSKYPDLLLEKVNELAEEVQHVKYHSGCAETYLRIAFGYIYTGKYKECDRFYREFLKCRINEEHFSEWTRGNIKLIKFVSTLWRIKSAIAKLKSEAATDAALSKEARDWLFEYPAVASEEMVILLAVALGLKQVTAKTVLWTEKSTFGIFHPKNHWWLLYGEDEIVNVHNTVAEVDLCYDRVSSEEDEERIIFFPNCHPIQTGSTVWVKENILSDLSLPPQLGCPSADTYGFTEDKYRPVYEIGERIRSFLERR